MTWITLTALCDAIVTLMAPLVEIVIHDLATQKIRYIKGGLSHRVVGDPSLLEEFESTEDLNKTVYSKLNYDGCLLKSLSVPIDNQWLVCINYDISLFDQMKKLSETFLKVQTQPEILFKNDWQEKLHETLHTYLQRRHWYFETLSQHQKKELVKFLFDQGAFNEKKAADYIARILNMGRATIFNYLKNWRTP